MDLLVPLWWYLLPSDLYAANVFVSLCLLRLLMEAFDGIIRRDESDNETREMIREQNRIYEESAFCEIIRATATFALLDNYAKYCNNPYGESDYLDTFMR